MVSRDTTVHVGAVMLAILVFLLLEALNIESGEGDVSVVVFLLVYGLVFGGAHFYLALRGEDGMVPVTARWRYIAMVLVLLGMGVISLEYGSRTIASIELSTIALLIAVLTLIVYFISENISAYRGSMTE